MLDYEDLFSRPSIEINTIWELLIRKDNCKSSTVAAAVTKRETLECSERLISSKVRFKAPSSPQ